MPYKKIFKMKTPLLISLLLLFSLFLPFAARAGSEGGGSTPAWEQFQKDVFNSGLTTSPAPTANINVGWRRQAGYVTAMAAGVNHTPVVAEGKVFVLDALGEAWAFDAGTGDQLWKTSLSCTGMKFQLATPVYYAGKLFVATNDGHVYALNAANGGIIWGPIKVPEFGSYAQLNTPVKYADGKVYVGSWSGNKTYYCLDAGNGNVLWKRPSTSGGGYYWAGACVVGDYLVFGDDKSVLTCVYKDSGLLVDEINLKERDASTRYVHSSVTYNPETQRVYFTDEGGHCWAFDFDSQTGKLTYFWHKKLGLFSTSTPAVYNGRVYVGTGIYTLAGKLYCLEEATGDVVWEFTPTDEGQCEYSVPGIQASPSLSIQDSGVYIYFITICERGTAYCLDENGKKLWSFTGFEAGTSQGYGTSSLAIAAGRVYFGNDGGWVYALKEGERPRLQKVSTDPADGATGVPADKVISVVFNRTIQEGPSFNNISFQDNAGASVQKQVYIDTGDTAAKLLIKPAASLAPATAYTVCIPEGAVADSVYSDVYNPEITFRFTTRAPPGGGGGDPSLITVYEQVTGMNGENFFSSSLRVEPGSSVLYVLLSTPGLTVVVDYNCPYITGGYVESINGQASPWGARSDGWIYFVNGEMPAFGAALYKVRDGDKINWTWGTMEGERQPGPGGSQTAAGLTAEDVEKAAQEGLKAVEKTIQDEITITRDALQKAAGLKMEMVLKLADGSLRLALPPGAAEVKGVLIVRAAPLTEAQAKEYLVRAAPGFKPVGKIYEIKAFQKEENQEKPVAWQKELILTISYRGLAVENEQNLAAFVFNEQSKQWDVLATGKVDSQKKEVSFAVAHFSKFALFERLPEEKIPIAKPALPAFKDLPEDHWAKEVIVEMAARGFLKGYPDGTCKPDSSVTRAEFAAFLARVLNLEEAGQEAIFVDVRPGDWYYQVVAAAYRRGLIKGYVEKTGSSGEQAEEQNFFCPDEQITREQVAAILVRALNQKGISPPSEAAQVAALLNRFQDANKVSAWARTSVAAAVSKGLLRGYPDQTVRPRGVVTRAECLALLKRLLES
jgi:outer membrane protein assembly factor BamB